MLFVDVVRLIKEPLIAFRFAVSPITWLIEICGPVAVELATLTSLIFKGLVAGGTAQLSVHVTNPLLLVKTAVYGAD
jgi:hypothetical protein